jgi:catechol 2,3-dioxygenase-like lactoylglutathione lyase family enzyme
MRIERLAFVAFPVTDLERAHDFYTRVLKLEVIDRAPASLDLRMGNVRLRLYVHHGEYRRQHSGLQFLVMDVNAAYQELVGEPNATRGTVRSEPWGGRVLTVADPDGNLLDLLDASLAQKSSVT